MQPYLFPYAGYFQLALVADRFVFYDDVQFIAQGYINRNRLPQGTFTVPLAAASHTTAIRDREVSPREYPRFLRKWRRGFDQYYRGEPYFEQARSILDQTFTPEEKSISQLAQTSVRAVCDYLDIPVAFACSSDHDYARDRDTQGRLLSLLDSLQTRVYINTVGGRHLYHADTFREHGIDLRFFVSNLPYAAPTPGFGYSILHLLARHPPAEIKQWLSKAYSLT